MGQTPLLCPTELPTLISLEPFHMQGYTSKKRKVENAIINIITEILKINKKCYFCFTYIIYFAILSIQKYFIENQLNCKNYLCNKEMFKLTL